MTTRMRPTVSPCCCVVRATASRSAMMACRRYTSSNCISLALCCSISVCQGWMVIRCAARSVMNWPSRSRFLHSRATASPQTNSEHESQDRRASGEACRLAVPRRTTSARAQRVIGRQCISGILRAILGVLIGIVRAPCALTDWFARAAQGDDSGGDRGGLVAHLLGQRLQPLRLASRRRFQRSLFGAAA